MNTSARSLDALASAEADCRRCPLYRDATQVVPGHGTRRARLFLVGEQPGDKEDLAGTPFVGPAGKVLNDALVQAGIERGEVFVTNAVKHFKFEPRGKKRLHKRPNAYEIDQCRWWFEQELELVRPRIVLAMGATAVRAVHGRAASIGSLRGGVHMRGDGIGYLVTNHPSYLLRIPDREQREAAMGDFVGDLRLAWNQADGATSN